MDMLTRAIMKTKTECRISMDEYEVEVNRADHFRNEKDILCRSSSSSQRRPPKEPVLADDRSDCSFPWQFGCGQ